MTRDILITSIIVSFIILIILSSQHNNDPLSTINQTERKKLLTECLQNDSLCGIMIGPTAQIDCMYKCARNKINSSYTTPNNILILGDTPNIFINKNETAIQEE